MLKKNVVKRIFAFYFDVYLNSVNFATSIIKTYYYAKKAEISSDGLVLLALGAGPERLHRA